MNIPPPVDSDSRQTHLFTNSLRQNTTLLHNLFPNHQQLSPIDSIHTSNSVCSSTLSLASVVYHLIGDSKRVIDKSASLRTDLCDWTESDKSLEIDRRWWPQIITSSALCRRCGVITLAVSNRRTLLHFGTSLVAFLSNSLCVRVQKNERNPPSNGVLLLVPRPNDNCYAFRSVWTWNLSRYTRETLGVFILKCILSQYRSESWIMSCARLLVCSWGKHLTSPTTATICRCDTIDWFATSLSHFSWLNPFNKTSKLCSCYIIEYDKESTFLLD